MITLLLILLIWITASTTSKCRHNICLTWYEDNNELVLVCEIPQLYHQVVFNSPTNIEYAFCVSPYPTSACFLNGESGMIYQDLRINQTILKISTSKLSLTILSGIWTCSHGTKGELAVANVTLSSKTGAAELLICRQHISFRKEILDDGLQLVCTVDDLRFPVTFTGPNCSIYGSCDSFGQCDLTYMTQDRTTNTTKLTIQRTVNFTFYGNWMCTHGYSNAFVLIESSNEGVELKRGDTSWITLACLVISLIFILTYTIYLQYRQCNKLSDFVCICLQHRYEVKHHGRSAKKPYNDVALNLIVEDNTRLIDTHYGYEESYLQAQVEDNTRLIDTHYGYEESYLQAQDGFSEPCHTCHDRAVCAICAVCEHVYCAICVAAHMKYYPEHGICQVQHVYTTHSNIKCKQCNVEKGTDVCTECIKLLCEPCTNHHLHPKAKMRKLNSQSTLTLTKELSYNKPVEITFKYKIPVLIGSTVEHPIRMCGIAFLFDNRIVVADSYKSQLKIYANAKLQFEDELINEPRGLTAMQENKIALTFPYNKEITIFNIEKSRIYKEKCIKMKDLGFERLRPFAISYDEGWFAVEVGEGEDGKILILEATKVIHKISNKGNFAYYTGNTIRLALDKKKERVFVSAMSKKTVSCVSFDGNVLWTFTVPSPRSLIFIPSLREKNLILASKRCDAIYQLNARDAKDNILLAKGDIKSPRYIAYNKNEQLLCIQVATNDGGEDLLVYQYHPAVTST